MLIVSRGSARRCRQSTILSYALFVMWFPRNWKHSINTDKRTSVVTAGRMCYHTRLKDVSLNHRKEGERVEFEPVSNKRIEAVRCTMHFARRHFPKWDRGFCFRSGQVFCCSVQTRTHTHQWRTNTHAQGAPFISHLEPWLTVCRLSWWWRIRNGFGLCFFSSFPSHETRLQA